MAKFAKIYMFGGLKGKSDPTDYIVGYQSKNGKYIDKRTSSFDCQVWYECDGHMFDTLKEAKEYCAKF